MEKNQKAIIYPFKQKFDTKNKRDKKESKNKKIEILKLLGLEEEEVRILTALSIKTKT